MVTKLASGWNSAELPGRMFATEEQALKAEAKKKSKKEKETAKKGKDWDPNPWAVCTDSVGREDAEKYERCVMDVKKKQ